MQLKGVSNLNQLLSHKLVIQGHLQEFTVPNNNVHDETGLVIYGSRQPTLSKIAYQERERNGWENSFVKQLGNFCIQTLYLGWESFETPGISEEYNFRKQGSKVHYDPENERDNTLVQAPLICLKADQAHKLPDIDVENSYYFQAKTQTWIFSSERINTLHIRSQLVEVGFTFSQQDLKDPLSFQEFITQLPRKYHDEYEEEENELDEEVEEERERFEYEAAKFKRYSIRVETLQRLEISPVFGEVTQAQTLQKKPKRKMKPKVEAPKSEKEENLGKSRVLDPNLWKRIMRENFADLVTLIVMLVFFMFEYAISTLQLFSQIPK
ncbi:hypothetical protein FGO68_gene16474 [Halteria grandinella]|uniref:Uncharacterized protein n=1 Tax=Halteria grandinella TaxID=5974 RepID=A0A8J8NP47_HALGN|nr:hypothetical protein FGO68_gene16474 [Halteria grandinella]